MCEGSGSMCTCVHVDMFGCRQLSARSGCQAAAADLVSSVPCASSALSTSACSSSLMYVTRWPPCAAQSAADCCAVPPVRLSTKVVLVEET